MTNYNNHIASVKDGAIVCFPDSACYYMKACDRNGLGGVVQLYRGLYISTNDLEEYYGLGFNIHIVADNLDELYREDNE